MCILYKHVLKVLDIHAKTVYLDKSLKKQVKRKYININGILDEKLQYISKHKLCNICTQGNQK